MFGCLNLVRVSLTNDIAGTQTVGNALALVQVSEPLRQFAENTWFRIRLDKRGRDTRGPQTLASFVPEAKTRRRVANTRYGHNDSVSG